MSATPYDQPLPGSDGLLIDRIARQINSSKIELRPLHEIIDEQREPQWLIHKILEKGVLAVISGKRSSFKSFAALDWSLHIAVAGHGVVMLSGEGAGLGTRSEGWLKNRAPQVDRKALKYQCFERPINLNQEAELLALNEAIGKLKWTPDLIVVDTFSKFSAGLDENKNADVAAYLSGLSKALRDKYSCSVLLVCHAGHGDEARPRGASALMANPDAEYLVRRDGPTGSLVSISRERFKDTASLPPLGYMAREIDLGRLNSYGEPITTVILDPTDTPTLTDKPKAIGKNQLKALAGLREWVRQYPEASLIASDDLAAVLKGQGLDRKRQCEAKEGMISKGVLVHSVAGYTINRDKL